MDFIGDTWYKVCMSYYVGRESFNFKTKSQPWKVDRRTEEKFAKIRSSPLGKPIKFNDMYIKMTPFPKKNWDINMTVEEKAKVTDLSLEEM